MLSDILIAVLTALLFSAVSAASACERTALRSAKQQGAIATQSNGVERRGLLCVSQSSKEQLRRSRTESSGAAPAIEELPGVARQCKARRAAMRRNWQHGPAFSPAGRSGGSQALQLPRPANSPRQPAYRPRSRPRTTEVGNLCPGTVLAHRRGLEGARPSSSHDSRFTAAACLSSPLPTAYHRSREFPPR